ncbi:aminoimidazole riboside kinase [Bacillus taeanensis]|uniref:Aminoimidazole riboside kinase n=1 Tax=Bacillus taeanensis TaxID=273032 RepID=A0A366XYL1_9BACI|nr:aminoimidazole riboside kinase [Bacillus taeanensis]RBW69011.1 aminoimidazole riboside kinase [Bacillus taeanensis]
MSGVISLGEALIDFIPLDDQNVTYQKSPGGAPANVAVGVSRLGIKSTFLGKVGNDVLGEFMKNTLNNYGVNVESMLLTDEARTGVVFVTLDDDGERHFSFYINPSADRFLSEDDLKEELFKEHKVFHFGSISMISEPAKSATKKAVALAKENDMVISYDPNLRLGLWEEEGQARETIQSMLGAADFLKISEEELTFITGEEEIEAGLQALKEYSIPLVLVTLGGEGSYIRFKGETVHVPAMKVKTVDTTGAGDAFVSGILYQLNELIKHIAELTVEEVKEIVEFASVSGALAASTKGAMTALPTKEQVEEILSK